MKISLRNSKSSRFLFGLAGRYFSELRSKKLTNSLIFMNFPADS